MTGAVKPDQTEVSSSPSFYEIRQINEAFCSPLSFLFIYYDSLRQIFHCFQVINCILVFIETVNIKLIAAVT